MHYPALLRRLIAPLGLGTLLLLTVGCASLSRPPSNVPTEAEERQHIVRVDANGVLRQVDNQADASEAYTETNLLEPLRDALLRHPERYPKGVLIFVHGGLNTYHGAHKHFLHLFPLLKEQGYYPLFLLWPSGLAGTYGDHLLNIRQGRRETNGEGRFFSSLTLPLVFAQDLATGLVRTPMTSLETLRSDLQTAIPARHSWSQEDAISIYRDLQQEGRAVIIGNDYKSGGEMALRTASYWLTLPSKLATAGPIIDSLGRPAWDDMIRRTYMVYPGTLADFTSSDTPAASAQQKTLTVPGEKGKLSEIQNAQRLADQTRVTRKEEARHSGLATVIKELERLQRTRSFPTTLVGHSMGTIVLNHVLEVTTLEVERIIYLAAACTVRDFSGSVLPYLAKHPATHSYNLSLHPMAEDGEWQTAIADLSPRGSLLVWIDNFLSNPVYEQDRTFGRWTNLFMLSPTGNSAIEDILNHRDIGDRIHFRAFGVGSGETPRGAPYQWNQLGATPPSRPEEFTPHRHGDLAKVEFWDQRVLDGSK